MRAREDLEARDNRRIIKEMNAGMRTGNNIYMNYFHEVIQSLKNMKMLQITHEVQWES
jgi:hypothetical protein